MLGKPILSKKPSTAVAVKQSLNPILTVQLLNTPIPNTLEELDKMEQVIAQRMAAINSISNNLTQSMIEYKQRGMSIRANQLLTRKSSLSSDIRQLSTKLMEIQEKRTELIAAAGLH
jgi:seryl-tRNA synthetase